MAIQLCKANAEKAKTEADCAIKLKEDTIAHTNEVIDQLTKRKNELSAAIDEAIATGNKQADLIIENYYTTTLDEYQRNLLESQINILGEAREQFNAEIAKLSVQYNNLKNEVEDFAARRDAINQEIIRQRKLAEEKDFYRICITENDLSDIEILRELTNKLHRNDFLNKIIYDTFVAKYVKEMSKRVLQGRDPSGIYKVSNILTNEVYVGKSVNVATRWTNHTKSAFGLEGVADSQFQRALKKYGVQNFTWELLEEVPKDQLSSREKYYIDFYDTTHYGYNMRNG